MARHPGQWSVGATARAMAVLAVATIILLAPFVNKAFHIDDPLFLWAARRIQAHPLDFYGFPVNWYGREMSMSDVMQNPPLTSYYIALVAAVAGWSEVSLHLAFLLPAVAAVLGSYALARELCPRPLLAALAGTLTPVFLVSSTNVMCDTMLLAFYVWASALWVRGLDGDRPLLLTMSALLMACAGLTKYYGATVVPLLLVYALVRRRSARPWAPYLAIPIVVFLGYQWWTLVHYGRGFLWDAAWYALAARGHGAVAVRSQALMGLSFAGGCLATAALYAPWVWSRRAMGTAMALGAAGVLALPLLESVGVAPLRVEGGARWTLVVHLGVFALAGVHLLALAVSDLWTRRDSGSVLLCLWVVGTFVFASFLNWTVNARSILPMAPAVGVLLVRRLGRERAHAWRCGTLSGLAPLVLGGGLALLVTSADYALANSMRDAADVLSQRFGRDAGTLWFQGHWGFQYYMESLGGRALDVTRSRLTPGDRVIVPVNNSNVFPMPAAAVSREQGVEFPAARVVTTMSPPLGAGFYLSGWGPLPFALGRIPWERYWVSSVLASLQYPER